MKKGFAVILLVLLLVSIFPAAVLADAPVQLQDYDEIQVYIDNFATVIDVQCCGYDKNNNYVEIGPADYTEKAKSEKGLILHFPNPKSQYKNFQLVIEPVGGQEIRSNFADLNDGGGEYIYTVADHTTSIGQKAKRSFFEKERFVDFREYTAKNGLPPNEIAHRLPFRVRMTGRRR